MDNSVIVTTPAELRAAIAGEIGKVVPKISDFRRKNEAVEVDSMTVAPAAALHDRCSVDLHDPDPHAVPGAATTGALRDGRYRLPAARSTCGRQTG